MSRNTILVCIVSVIGHAHASANDDDCRTVMVKTHEVHKISTLLLFKENRTVQKMLKAGTRSSQITSLASYFRDVAHRFMNASVGPVVAAQVVL